MDRNHGESRREQGLDLVERLENLVMTGAYFSSSVEIDIYRGIDNCIFQRNLSNVDRSIKFRINTLSRKEYS